MSVGHEQNDAVVNCETAGIMGADLATLSDCIRTMTAKYQSPEFEWLYSKEVILDDGFVINIDYTEPDSSTHGFFVAFRYLNEDGENSILRYQWDCVSPEEKKLQIVSEINPRGASKSARARTPFNQEDMNKIRWLVSIAAENGEHGQA